MYPIHASAQPIFGNLEPAQENFPFCEIILLIFLVFLCNLHRKSGTNRKLIMMTEMNLVKPSVKGNVMIICKAMQLKDKTRGAASIHLER